MAIQQTKKLSDLEKRLRLLRQQVYGRPVNQQISESVDQKKASDTLTHSLHEASRYTPISSGTAITSDIKYLYQDLMKILSLAGLALGVQIILFFLSRNHVLNLNFF